MRTRPWTAALVSAVASALLLAACVPMATMTTHPAQQPAPSLPAAPTASTKTASTPALPWPTRMPIDSGLSVDTLRSLRRATTGEPWQPMGAIMPLQTPVRFGRPAAADLANAAKDGQRALNSVAATLEIVNRLHKEMGVAAGVSIQTERNGAFLVEPVPARDRADTPPTPRAGKSNLAFQFVTLKPVPIRDNTAKPQAELERTAFFYYDPALGWLDDGTPIDPLTPKGLVVILPGMFGTPGDQIADLVKLLRQRGYAVLRMMAHSSRFTETIRFAAPLDNDADITAAGATIARELTDRAAECAYAIEAAVAYVRQERPSLSTLPLAAVGMSGGAMVLPTVTARDPEAWSALVFIGGGTDYLRIMATSNYSDWINAAKLVWMPKVDAQAAIKRAIANKGGEANLMVSPMHILDDGRPDLTRAVGLAIRPPSSMSETTARYILSGDTDEPRPTRAQVDRLLAAYRTQAPLDSANVAPLLGPAGANVPSLLIVGTTDRAVPAATGEELWQLLGKPERWSIAGGHEWLFLTLPGRLPKLADWLDSKLAPTFPRPAPGEGQR